MNHLSFRKFLCLFLSLLVLWSGRPSYASNPPEKIKSIYLNKVYFDPAWDAATLNNHHRQNVEKVFRLFRYKEMIKDPTFCTDITKETPELYYLCNDGPLQHITNLEIVPSPDFGFEIMIYTLFGYGMMINGLSINRKLLPNASAPLSFNVLMDEVLSPAEKTIITHQPDVFLKKVLIASSDDFTDLSYGFRQLLETAFDGIGIDEIKPFDLEKGLYEVQLRDVHNMNATRIVANQDQLHHFFNDMLLISGENHYREYRSFLQHHGVDFMTANHLVDGSPMAWDKVDLIERSDVLRAYSDISSLQQGSPSWYQQNKKALNRQDNPLYVKKSKRLTRMLFVVGAISLVIGSGLSILEDSLEVTTLDDLYIADPMFLKEFLDSHPKMTAAMALYVDEMIEIVKIMP